MIARRRFPDGQNIDEAVDFDELEIHAQGWDREGPYGVEIGLTTSLGIARKAPVDGRTRCGDCVSVGVAQPEVGQSLLCGGRSEDGVLHDSDSRVRMSARDRPVR